MNRDYFRTLKILDGGLGQELLSRGVKAKGTLWSASALIEEKYHELLIKTHLDFIKAGADVITTNTFATRRIRLKENRALGLFKELNELAGKLAIKARHLSKKNVLIAGSLPPQNSTYLADKRERNEIEKDFFSQAELINEFSDFFYLDVLSSIKEIEIGNEISRKFNKKSLIGIHIKNDGKLPSGESIKETLTKIDNENILGVIFACVSPEIIDKNITYLKDQKLPFGFKFNLWKVNNPLPAFKLNKAKFNEIGNNPNKFLGVRKNFSDKIFQNFIENMQKKGATIMGGCCETNINHVKEMCNLKSLTQ